MNQYHQQPSTRSAFTLVELLVVLASMAVLTGLTLCAVMQVRASAARTHCSHRLRQLGLALHNYHGTNSVFPPGIRTAGPNEPQPYLTWLARLLPYLEQEALWKQTVSAYQGQPNYLLLPHPFDKVMPAFECPSNPRSGHLGYWFGLTPGLTSYLGVEGTDHTRKDGILFADSQIRLTDVVDGTSHTLLVGERPPVLDLYAVNSDGALSTPYGWWYSSDGIALSGTANALLGTLERNYSPFAQNCPLGPYEFGPGRIDNMCDTFHFWSLHPGGANFVFADGSVRFLSYEAKSVLPALSTRAGGEVAEIP